MASRQSEEITGQMVVFAVAIIKMVDKIDIPLSVKNQIVRSSGSIGANFSEAQESASKKDFINKIAIAKKEANETKYWLMVISELGYKDTKLEQDVQKFLMILQKIISTAKGADRA